MASRPFRFTIIFAFVLLLFLFIIGRLSHQPDHLPTNSQHASFDDNFTIDSVRSTLASTFSRSLHSVATTSNQMTHTRNGGGGGGGSQDVDDPGSLTPEEYLKWCRDFTGVTMYTIGARLSCTSNRISFCLALMLAIFFSLLIELFLHKFEHGVRNKVTQELVNKVFRELTMLGLITYGVNFMESTFIIEKLFLAFEPKGQEELNLHELTQRRVLIFELVHVLLFGLSLFFIFTVVICYVQVKLTWKHWEHIEKKDEKESMQKALTVKRLFRSSNIFLRYLNIFSLWGLWKAEDTISYWSCRRQFILSNGLPHNFRYFVYLKDRVRRLLVELSEIGYPLWILVFLIALGDIGRSLVLEGEKWIDNALVFVLLFFCASSVGCTVVLMIVRLSYALYLRQTSKDRHLKHLFDSDFLTESLVSSRSHDESEMLEDAVASEHNEPVAPELSYQGTNTASPLEDIHTESSVQPAAANFSNHSKHHSHTRHLDMKKFFLLRSPRLYLMLMQLVLFVQCFYLALLTLHYLNYILFTNGFSQYIIVRIAFLIFAYLSAFYVFLVFPFLVAPFTILSSQENLSSFSSIQIALEHMRKWPNGKTKANRHHSDKHQPYLDYQTSGANEELRELVEKYKKKQEKKQRESLRKDGEQR